VILATWPENEARLLIGIEIPSGTETGDAEMSKGREATATAESEERCIATDSDDDESYTRREVLFLRL